MIFHGAEDEVYKALPKKAGTAAHKRVESESDGLTWNVPVISEEYGLFGVVDALDENPCRLLEYKNHVRGIYPGQRLQMQAQYVCLLEMGFLIYKRISVYKTSIPTTIVGPSDRGPDDEEVYKTSIPTTIVGIKLPNVTEKG